MEILSAEQMRRVDRRAIEQFDIPGVELMEAAGRGVAEALLADFRGLQGRSVTILCGKGNNGGDGLVAARHLVPHGLKTRTLLLAAADQLRGDSRTNHRAAVEAGLHVEEITSKEQWDEVASQAFAEEDIVVLDALLGTGVRGGARGLYAHVIEQLNRSAAAVVSIDLPSGLDPDATRTAGVVVRAERTYTLCRPKPALIFSPAADQVGRWRVIPIGIPAAAVEAEGARLCWLDAAAARERLPTRSNNSHKGSYGHLLVVAGSHGKSGAALLAGRGALRSGAGLVTVACPGSVRGEVAQQQAELMTAELASLDALIEMAASRDAVAIGPGLGDDSQTIKLVREFVTSCPSPMVLDADALNALDDASLRRLQEAPAARVLTPHPGEAARLLGRPTTAVQANRRDAARTLAAASGAVVVLKGHRSLVSCADDRMAVNGSGNPGMATAGSGDVLTGMLGAALARGLTAWDAACLSVWTHGAAGDAAAREQGQEGMIASDLIDALPATLKALHAPENRP